MPKPNENEQGHGQPILPQAYGTPTWPPKTSNFTNVHFGGRHFLGA